MTDENKPRLIVVAGPNGAGKTTITDKLLRHEWMEGCEYINPDVIAQNEFGDWNSTDAVVKAADKAKILRENCLSRMESMAFETVFSTPEKLEFVSRYYRSIATCVQAISLLDRAYFYDNSESNVDPQLIFRVSDGSIAKMYLAAPPWAQDIIDAIGKNADS
jgi:predicted ABC-type ATPase